MKLKDNPVFLNPKAAVGSILKVLNDGHLQEIFKAAPAPKKFVTSQNFEKKVVEFIQSQDNTLKLAGNCRKIGLHDDCFLMSSYDGSTYYIRVVDDRVYFAVFYQSLTPSLVFSAKLDLNPDKPLPLIFSGHYSDSEMVHRMMEKSDSIKENPHYFILTLMLGIGWVFIFMHFCELLEVTVEPRQKYRPKKYEPVKNTLDEKITVVDVNWDTATNIDVPFAVAGHYRQQRVGERRQKIKIIYIEPFQKKGYHRKAGKKNLKNE